MPLPERQPNESYDEFIVRCMSDPVMVEEFPDTSQRRAVCERQSRVNGTSRLTLICEPGGVTIEAADSVEEIGQPALPRFSMIAYTGRAIRVSGWRYPVVIDLAGLVIPSQNRPVRFAHDESQGVGHTNSIYVDGDRVIATGVVSRDTPAAREIVISARHGFPWQASIAADVEDVEFIDEGQKVVVNGKEFEGPINVVRRARLGEISFVDLGADDNTRASVVASGQEPRSMEATVDTNHKQVDGGTTGSDVHATEASRVLAIRMICGGRHPEIEEQAIREGWDVNKTALAVLRAERPHAPAIQVARDPRTVQHLEAAACLRYGVPEHIVIREYGERVVTEADRYRSRGIQWMAQQLASMRGIDLDDSPGSARWIRAAFSMSELVGIVGAVANKALAAAFQAAPATVPKIAAAVSVTNFHTHTVFSLAITGELQPVAPNGELKHLALGEESYTRQISTRGAILSITRQDLINDDLGALTRAATILGQKAVLARERALYELINSTGNGTSFFTSDRGNYFEGATSALSVDSLGTAVQKFRDMKDASGLPLLVEPRILLVPSTLEVTAKRLMAAQTYIATGVGNTRVIEGAQNIWEGAFEVVVSPLLNNPAIGGSNTAWYLLADPNVVPCFEVAYLNGVQVPTVEFFGLDTEVNVLGVTYRVYWDFGAALAEYRAGVKSKGAA